MMWIRQINTNPALECFSNFYKFEQPHCQELLFIRKDICINQRGNVTCKIQDRIMT